MIENFYLLSYNLKREKQYQSLGTSQKYEYDFNVRINRYICYYILFQKNLSPKKKPKI